MKLLQAIENSEYRAAILYMPTYNYVVVENPQPWYIGNKYGTEIHRYDENGILDFVIISFRPINYTTLTGQLGEFIYSNIWYPYSEEAFTQESIQSLGVISRKQTIKRYSKRMNKK